MNGGSLKKFVQNLGKNLKVWPNIFSELLVDKNTADTYQKLCTFFKFASIEIQHFAKNNNKQGLSVCNNMRRIHKKGFLKKGVLPN